MLRAIMFLAGFVAAVAGVALLSVPAALIVGGVAACAIAVQLERTAPKRGDA